MKKSDRLAESYRILGVSPGASLKQIKKVFHEKALLYHPDANPGASAAHAEFKNITRAYGIIREHLKKQAAGSRQRAAGSGQKINHPAPPDPGAQGSDAQGFNGYESFSAPSTKHQAPGTRGQAADTKPQVPGTEHEAARRAALNRFRNRKLQERDAQVGQMAARLSAGELSYRLEHSENPYVRLHAVRALAVQGGKPAAWPIIRALSDPDPDVMRTAAEALGALRARAASMPLIRLHQISDPATKAIAHTALTRINSPLARRFLATLNNQQSEPQHQKHSTDIA